MAEDCCTEALRVSKIKVAENGRQAVFLNPERQPYKKIKIDGCLIVNSTACDWWVIRVSDESVLIELKGTDVDHALEQIEKTFEFLKSEGRLTDKVAALIVCRKPSQHPSFTAKLQKARSRLSKSYKAPLHIVAGSYEFDIAKVLSHSGPF